MWKRCTGGAWHTWKLGTLRKQGPTLSRSVAICFFCLHFCSGTAFHSEDIEEETRVIANQETRNFHVDCWDAFHLSQLRQRRIIVDGRTFCSDDKDWQIFLKWCYYSDTEAQKEGAGKSHKLSTFPLLQVRSDFAISWMHLILWHFAIDLHTLTVHKVAACRQLQNVDTWSRDLCHSIKDWRDLLTSGFHLNWVLGTFWVLCGNIEMQTLESKPPKPLQMDFVASWHLGCSQEAELKARKQFKGLFDKRPGELSQEGPEETLKQNSTQESLITKETQSGTQENPEEEDDKEEYDMSQKATTRLHSLYKVGERFLRRFSNGKCTILWSPQSPQYDILLEYGGRWGNRSSLVTPACTTLSLPMNGPSEIWVWLYLW